ncbi:MAG TPA: hypothetical protein PKD72_13100 [Gemmatales bacterium]|nr:hypothetical protein [Gemmatales bacterium]
MLKSRTLLILLASTLMMGCQWGKSSAWNSPPRRSDDPLLCTDAERKRPRDLYATTSDNRYASPLAHWEK